MVVALLGMDERGTVKKAESIRNDIEQMSFNNLPDIHVTISAGVAVFEVGTAFDEVIKRADKALYEAKETGRNKVVTYSENFLKSANL
jgi:diguanylate cyclase (GGDEF)-like protein